MKWKVMDVTDMHELANGSFDIVLDKSVIDTLLCGDDSFINLASMLKECQRVLKVGGVYFSVSYGKPDSRSYHFTHPFLSVTYREFILYDSACETQEEKEEKAHYSYVFHKLEDADE